MKKVGFTPTAFPEIGDNKNGTLDSFKGGKGKYMKDSTAKQGPHKLLSSICSLRSFKNCSEESVKYVCHGYEGISGYRYPNC